MAWEELVTAIGDSPVHHQKSKDEYGSFLNNSVNKNHNSFSEFYFGQTLYENQIDIVKAITATGVMEVDIVEPRQAGKCLAKGMIVIMYDGTRKKVEDVCVNDLLMGEDSTPRKVLSLAHGNEEMYKIIPRLRNYESFTVNASHILSIINRDQRYKIVNMSVLEYLASAKWNRTDNFRGWRVPLEFKEQTLPVHPYWLGIWIGNGIASSTSIANIEPEISEFFKQYAQALGLQYRRGVWGGKCPIENIAVATKQWICGDNHKTRRNVLCQFLKQYNLLNRKHIPHIFFANSRANRLQLLAGIIDTDGYKSFVKVKENICEVSSSKYTLAQDILLLFRSLGFRASMKKRNVKYVYKGIRSDKIAYRIMAYGDFSIVPTRVKRKQWQKSVLRENPLLFGFDIKPVGIGEYYGFIIDGNGLFVLGDCTVTHNTSAVAVSCAIDFETVGAEWNKYNAEPYRIGIFGPKLAQAQIDLSRIKLWAANNSEGRSLINWKDTTNSVIRWHNGCEVHAVSASEQTETEGFTFNKAILEEAQKISDHAVSQVITPMIGAVGGKIIKIGTVRAIRNHFWRSCNKNPRTKKIAHHWLLCGNYLRNSGFIEYNGNKISNFILERMPWMLKEKYMLNGYFPNTPDFMFYGDMEYDDFLTQYELEWLEQYGLFMSREEIERMFLGQHPFEFSQVSSDCDYFAGIDFATGDEQDDTAVSVFKKIGNLKRKVFGITWGNLPIPDQKRELVNLFGPNGKFHCKTILGDVGGNGQAIIEDLRAEYNLPVYAVAFNSTDKDVKVVSINMKTSMFNDYRREIQNGFIQHFGIDSTTPKEVQVQYRKARREWETLEQETRKDTVNKTIQATDSEHDDICCADALGLRAMKLSGRIMGSQQVLLHRIPYAVVTQSPFQ